MNELSFDFVLSMEAFTTMFMSIFVFYPLSKIYSKQNSKKIFCTMFIIRILILLFFDFFITTSIVIVDFIFVFIGIFIIIPLSIAIKKIKLSEVIDMTNKGTLNLQQKELKNNVLKCSECNSILQITDKFCTNCGKQINKNDIAILENTKVALTLPKKTAVLPSNFDKIYSLPEDKMVEEFISRELAKSGVDRSSKLIPSDILKRKKILNMIFSILVFVYISLIFFHFPIYTYIIGIALLFVFFKITRNYDLIKYLKKQLKARPGEKISNIVMNIKNTFIRDNSKFIFIISLLVAVILPLIIFSSPRVIYEKVDGGYAVRYYIFGLTNYKTVTIDETYKNEKVVSLRGNTFSNMPFLESVNLPDSIIEMRGQVFKNCYKLTEVNIPKKLEYLGGGSFYNAKSIKRIELPDTLTYLGGESFYGAESLEYVKLSKYLTEIKGNSFEYCTSLKNITIPDNVMRIGAHAFYGNSSLSEVLISENSKLSEIGSSAFRQCTSLYNIKIPYGTYVNERAFKESPTIVNRYSNHQKNCRYVYGYYQCN